jgi:hypothetical protein
MPLLSLLVALSTGPLAIAERYVPDIPHRGPNEPYTQCVNGVCTTYYPAVIQAERLKAEQERLELERKRFELEHPKPKELTKEEKEAIKREEHRAKVEAANKKAREANERYYQELLEGD